MKLKEELDKLNRLIEDILEKNEKSLSDEYGIAGIDFKDFGTVATKLTKAVREYFKNGDTVIISKKEYAMLLDDKKEIRSVKDEWLQNQI